ncbi:MAG TPA: hypothetical protein VLB87_13280 [Pyrinomonadaceae bacterium]|nr:hypothetical protein [Pyrinomonadaceae bacterium]
MLPELQDVDSEPAILVDRNSMRPGHASFFMMHFEWDENSQMSRSNFVFAPSKLAALKRFAGVSRPLKR